VHWESRLQRILFRAVGPHRGGALLQTHLPFLSDAYRALTSPRLAAGDLLMLENLCASGNDRVALRRCENRRHPGRFLLRIGSRRERYLDEVLPHLKHVGLRVANHLALPIETDTFSARIDSYTVEPARPSLLPLSKTGPHMLECLGKMLMGEAESDELNGLALSTGLSWQAIDLLRAYRNYALQLKPRYTADRFHQAVLRNPVVAALLFRYFDARFSPDAGAADARQREEDAFGGVCAALADALRQVTDPLEDHILRELFNLIDATLRTNFYRRIDDPDYLIAIKLDDLGLLQLPNPKPRYEIYVHAMGMEGIHLRGGKVARGGIRWSERPDDFRMEILGLMRTQMVKNALIVPQGAKGGFIVKHPDGTAAQRQAAYRTLIRGMLDLTDNIVDGIATAPQSVLCYDDPDPYLVVAADKGTAKFSDTANALAENDGFWLGDAFASGGSHGYDHKALGITAKGAWECVRQHFQEMGRDADREPLTALGIGSMDGDVFGNGMLLSKNLRLRAAFDGRHIFIDPNPAGEPAWQERQRLFEFPGSSWNDYDRSLISAGGGIHPRDAKDIVLSAPLRQWLGVHMPTMDGEDLIRSLLTAPVDLLWLGGIGTYFKASDEINETIGDRANDSVRVDAARLRAKVVAEGANLGFTQRARIEYARLGGRINIDAVDNSAGVDLSDHEVNLKILMRGLERKGLIAGRQERDRWLQELAPDICTMVTAHNRRQCQCLSMEQARSQTRLETFLEVAHRLENAGLLDRNVEGFPSERELKARQPAGLTRPELAILMLYAKLAIKRALLETRHLLASPVAMRLYLDYFPQALRQRYGANLHDHGLAAEITATQIGNHIIHAAGAGFLVTPADFSSEAITEAAERYLRES
jgi:glutamate dehydrogenase